MASSSPEKIHQSTLLNIKHKPSQVARLSHKNSTLPLFKADHVEISVSLCLAQKINTGIINRPGPEPRLLRTAAC